MNKDRATYWIHHQECNVSTEQYTINSDAGIEKLFETFKEALTWCRFSGKSFYDNVNNKLYA